MRIIELKSLSFGENQIDNLQEMLQQHASQIAGLEKERDFYYQKLRDVEVVCQEPECESLGHIQKILEILYATEVCHEDLFFLSIFHFYRNSTYFSKKEGFEIPDDIEQETNIDQEF